MPVFHDDVLSFRALNGTPGRCQWLVFLAWTKAPQNGYLVLLTDDRDAEGMSISNAAETIAATVCRRWNIPPAWVQSIAHYGSRHLPGGDDSLDRSESLSRVEFPLATAASLARNLTPMLRFPSWRHIDMQTVKIQIGEPLP